ncbi:hypothetical protein PQR75_06585 [Paraburkholderia fungorum]|uniref:hypothetical protein n=1 Tax=Paraburkholderia fungorum TaxID=134537 RepID=UPI0038BA585E
MAENAARTRANPDKRAARNGRYKARKSGLQPKWVWKYSTVWKHRQADNKTIVTGIEHVADHIVPLLGPIAASGPFKGERLVYGWDVPWNLQVITAIENVEKGNRYWPDMPEPIQNAS